MICRHHPYTLRRVTSTRTKSLAGLRGLPRHVDVRTLTDVQLWTLGSNIARFCWGKDSRDDVTRRSREIPRKYVKGDLVVLVESNLNTEH